ncbi:TetR/AcrR family transcriptional regulator C-terminal domain-containing protein [Amycolatopsis sp.]|uniref:TetR/AcrR family transcriptional regulator C-terminal domain-containing protein n=1 Tax=Amycolatopsis sp. TaxID=37632 RepID=UPI002C594E2A|nr:TetR/AcrR family transcriptional regulator C-terminal domain-containing protein [Amycolatopsis sp.]HVV11514.1 TetR/AcrR family transcriptional regulator C-terminal domain-containing protein [Amycolatopsis sp.]
MSRETLSREKVLDAALRLADQNGLGGLSMRKLATELGVEAMSLYNHVRNKRDLLDGIAARVLESIPLPDAKLSWENRLRELAYTTFAAFNAHPAVAQALAAGEVKPLSRGALRLIDAMVGAFLDAGLTEPHAVRGYRSMLGMVFGAVLVGSSAPGGQPAAKPVEWFQRNVSAKDLPHLHRVLPDLVEVDCAQDFEFQLELFLNGLANSGTCS